MIAVLPFLFSVIGAGLALTGFKTEKGRNILLAVCLLVALVSNSYSLFQSISNHNFYVYGHFTGNAAGFFISEIILFLGFLIFLYSIAYLRDGRNLTIYFVIFMLFLASVIGLALSFNLLLMYAMIEISTITSAILILYQRTRVALRSVGIYIALSLFGAVFILVGTFLLYNSLGTLDLTRLLVISYPLPHKIVIALLLTVGFGIKVGLVPAGLIWLPKAYSEAPTPVSALLSGILAHVVAFALIRSVGLVALGETLIYGILLGLGLLSAFVGSVLVLFEVFGVKVGYYQFRSDIKRVLAFSSISEVGIIIFIVGLVVSIKVNILVILTVALIHITNHALAKSNLFLSAGNFIRFSKTRDMKLYKGLLHNLPVTASSFILGGLSLSMIPPLFGFTTLREIGAIAGYRIFTPLLIVIALLTFIGYMSCFIKIFKVHRHTPSTLNEKHLKTIVPILILDIVLVILSLGFFFGVLDSYQLGLEEIARTILEI